MTAAEDAEVQASDDIIRGKGILDGAATLGEAAQMARAFADLLMRKHYKGWRLRKPVDGDCGFIYRTHQVSRSDPLPIDEAIAIGQAGDIIARRILDAIGKGGDAIQASHEAAAEIRRLWTPANTTK